MTYTQSVVISPNGSYAFVTVPDERDDLGPRGTPEAPRTVEVDLLRSIRIIEVRSGEAVVVEERARVKIKGRVRAGAQGVVRPHVETTLTLNEWRQDRTQYEDRLLYSDRDDDYYLEVWTKSGTRDVTWVSAPQRLSDHRNGAAREAGSTPPEWLHLPLGRRDDVGGSPTAAG